MANERKREGGRWSGEEVERRPTGEAEAAAQRAEGLAPVPAGRGEPDALEAQPQNAHRRVAVNDNSDDETADTAEEHREDEPARHRPGHGKL
jgi:hypothetical protein